MTKEAKSKWLINQLYDISDKTLPKNLIINHTEFSVLAAICKGVRNGTNKSKMGYARIHRLTGGISKNTIIRSIKSMKQKQVITVHVSVTSNKDQDDNEYEIHLNNLVRENTKIIFSEDKIEGVGVPTMGRGGVPTMAPYKALSKNNYQKQKLLDIVHDENLNNVVTLPTDDRFEDFWASYPRKEKKLAAKHIWIREGLDRLADGIIEDVRQRQIRHDRWEDRSYIPLPTTYLNNEGWKDEITERKKLSTGKQSGSEPGNIRSYAEQLLRAANQAGGITPIRPMQNNMGRKVDEEF